MRILTLATCLVAVACATVVTPPPKERTYFAQAEDAGIISEADFYGSLLPEFDPITPYNIIVLAAPIDPTSPTERCKDAKDESDSELVGFVSTLDNILGMLPIGDYIRSFINKIVHSVDRMLHDGWHSFNLVGGNFRTLSNAVQSILEKLSGELGCSSLRSKVIGEAAAPAQCYELADFYRGAIANTLEHPPTTTDMSADIKRLVDGSATILDIMSKSSIAIANEDILTTRPVFAAAELLQCRDELMGLSESEDIQKYAAGALSVIINMSNALKPCIMIATNVAVAEGSIDANEGVKDGN
ncbi:MAG: hypothetical protein BYD32DRAFT_460600 [Podila humilis]|nr:MAG: hypothetical protein BYD32DRAFT_460600 [Podila humilis]